MGTQNRFPGLRSSDQATQFQRSTSDKTEETPGKDEEKGHGEFDSQSWVSRETLNPGVLYTNNGEDETTGDSQLCLFGTQNRNRYPEDESLFYLFGQVEGKSEGCGPYELSWFLHHNGAERYVGSKD